MAIRIVSVGKRHESWLLDGIERYQKRLRRPFDIEWDILPHSAIEDARACQDESGRILSRLNANDYVILLDEIGKNITSPGLSALLLDQVVMAKNIVIIIGGAYGVDDSVKKRANFIWSLSNLVFPHQLVRLILIEQIYRAQEIANSRPYHHE